MKSRIAIYSICVIGLIVGAFYDYPITDALYAPTAPVAVFFEQAVPNIIYLAAGIACAIVIRMKKNLWLLLLEVGIFAFTYGHGLKYLYSGASFLSWGCLAFTAGMTALSIWLAGRIPREVLQRIYPMVKVYLQVLITSVFIVNVMKLLWDRARYRELIDISGFTAWYVPFGTGGSSFPSGHTCAVSSILCLMEIKMKSTAAAWIRNILLGAAIVVMMVTRMMMGAHFLSDTIVGFLITYTCYLFYSGKFKRKKQSRDRKIMHKGGQE